MERVVYLLLELGIVALVFYWPLFSRRLRDNIRSSTKGIKSFYVFALLLPILFIGALVFLPPDGYSACYLARLSEWQKWSNILHQIKYYIYFLPVITLVLAVFLLIYTTLRGGKDGRRVVEHIIYIVALLSIFSFLTFVANASCGHDCQIKRTLSSLRTTMELYYDSHGAKYPIVHGNTPAERWAGLEIALGQDLPDHICYSQHGEPKFQYDYKGRENPSQWVASGFLKNPFERSSSGELLNQWCVDSEGFSRPIVGKEIKGFNCPN
ncbi:MAG: hypothetical protein AAB417_01015 [Patescibacteria group bacterium]